jgi:hypothetical protein
LFGGRTSSIVAIPSKTESAGFDIGAKKGHGQNRNVVKPGPTCRRWPGALAGNE